MSVTAGHDGALLLDVKGVASALDPDRGTLRPSAPVATSALAGPGGWVLARWIASGDRQTRLAQDPLLEGLTGGAASGAHAVFGGDGFAIAVEPTSGEVSGWAELPKVTGPCQAFAWRSGAHLACAQDKTFVLHRVGIERGSTLLHVEAVGAGLTGARRLIFATTAGGALVSGTCEDESADRGFCVLRDSAAYVSVPFENSVGDRPLWPGLLADGRVAIVTKDRRGVGLLGGKQALELLPPFPAEIVPRVPAIDEATLGAAIAMIAWSIAEDDAHTLHFPSMRGGAMVVHQGNGAATMTPVAAHPALHGRVGVAVDNQKQRAWITTDWGASWGELDVPPICWEASVPSRVSALGARIGACLRAGWGAGGSSVEGVEPAPVKPSLAD